jgi:Flp pilus assembly pilin Flp
MASLIAMACIGVFAAFGEALAAIYTEWSEAVTDALNRH